MYQHISYFAEEISDLLRLKTSPIAIKLLKVENEIPSGSIRPKLYFGHHMSLCQAISLSRKTSKYQITLLKEDMWCCEPVIGLGMAEPPQYFLEGHIRYPDDVISLEAGAYWSQKEFPKLSTNECIGVVISPLGVIGYQPDVVIIYANPEQLTLLALASAYKSGEDIVSKICPHASCVYSIVPVIQTKRPRIVLFILHQFS
ncbi:MAG: DUF169 domain-containing protein [Candidatus Bathyarchaeia archaeon]